MVGRTTVEDELEDVIERPPYMTHDVWRGQTRGKANLFSKKVEANVIRTCAFKSIIKVKSLSTSLPIADSEFKEFITPTK